MSQSVLIVEDDSDIREDLAELLRDEGVKVQTAANGAEAIARLQSGAQQGSLPCLILLDLMMPVMNGWDFRAKQLSSPEIARIPTVVLSGAADVRHHAATLHAVGYLSKPIELEQLFKLVSQHC